LFIDKNNDNVESPTFEYNGIIPTSSFVKIKKYD